jgi:16S rRNA (adenine1518-N6/adenine1519-N6)-dimethyltransferase
VTFSAAPLLRCGLEIPDRIDQRAALVAALPPLREVIARHGLAARHSLGQHFLLDSNLTGRIVRASGALSGRQVIEVGPGPGGLTRALLASDAARVIAVEIDSRAIGALQELQAVFPDRLQLIEADARTLDLRALADQGAPVQVVANLPYNVATPLLIGWLRQAAQFERLTLMFQQEVAERICAAPDTPAYGRLAVLAQFVCEVDLLLRLPPAAFTPAPKVWSAVVGFIPHLRQPSLALFAAMERTTASAFGQRRKMLRAAMKAVGGESLLRAAEIEPQRRGETLTVAEFERLALKVVDGGT